MNDEKGQNLYESIPNACNYFFNKYGVSPNLVEIHPLDNPGFVRELEYKNYTVGVVNNPAILRNHLLVGVMG